MQKSENRATVRTLAGKILDVTVTHLVQTMLFTGNIQLSGDYVIELNGELLFDSKEERELQELESRL